MGLFDSIKKAFQTVGHAIAPNLVPSPSASSPPPGIAPQVQSNTPKPIEFSKDQLKNLTIGIGPGKSTNCLTCAITVDPTLSSATVTLSRDILGKIQMAPLPYPPSNLPEINKNGNGNSCGNKPEGGYGPPDNPCCNNGCDYTVPYPNNGENKTTLSWRDGTILSDHGSHGVSGNHTSDDWTNEYIAQRNIENQHKKAWDEKNSKRTGVRIWNPSDDPKDPKQSIAINYREFGALTKLFVKPTIPFPVSFSLVGPGVPKLEPPPAPPTENPRQTISPPMDNLERKKQARQNPLAFPNYKAEAH